MRNIILQKLNHSLGIPHSYLDVIDESHLHHGHAGNTKNGESHFQIILHLSQPMQMDASQKLELHRKIYDILKDEMRNIHALSIKINNVSIA